MLSVVVPTLNRPEVAAQAVADAFAQLPRDGELVVVDQSDEPGFASLSARVVALGDARVRHVWLRQRGLPNARNVGVQSTSGELLLFLDDDVRLRPGCLAAHIAAYADPAVGGVVGRIFEASVRPNSAALANRVDAGGRVRTRLDGAESGAVATLKGANMSLRRAVFAEIGGFDRNYGGTAFLEDADLSTRARRAGWALRFEADAALDHLSAPTGGVRQADALRTETWRFHNTGYFMRRHRGRRSLAPLLVTFGAIALKRGAEWRDPTAPRTLLTALRQGWQLAKLPPATGWSY